MVVFSLFVAVALLLIVLVTAKYISIVSSRNKVTKRHDPFDVQLRRDSKMEKSKMTPKQNQKTVTSPLTAAQMKEKVKNYFVEIEDDKFTKVKKVECKERIVWSSTAASNIILPGARNESLTLLISYVSSGGEDQVILGFVYGGRDGGFPGMENLKMYLIVDNDKTIELTDVHNHEATSNGDKEDMFITYIEHVLLGVPMPDMISIANAKRIEYSIRMASGKVEGVFNDHQLTIFKGFYNNTFDEEFELEPLYRAVIAEKPKPPAVKKEESGGCYIATEVYGDYDHPQVVALRTFRDDVLLKSNLGKSFVEWYYLCSPKLVDLIGNQREVNSVVRRLLDLFIEIVQKVR